MRDTWIEASERLPTEADGKCLVELPGGEVLVFRKNADWEGAGVIRWQPILKPRRPLPELPEWWDWCFPNDRPVASMRLPGGKHCVVALKEDGWVRVDMTPGWTRSLYWPPGT